MDEISVLTCIVRKKMGMERNTEKGKEVSMFKLKFLGISDSYDPNYDYDYDYYP